MSSFFVPGMKTVKINSAAFQAVLLLTVLLVSCGKEKVPPEIKEEPVFFVQGTFNGKPTILTAGLDSFYVQPSANTDGDLSGYLPKYYSTFTNGKDSFSVVLVGNKLLSPKAPDRNDLEDVLDHHSLEYAAFVFGGDIDILYKYKGKLYRPDLNAIPAGSYFNIIHSEDYYIPGDTRLMKKADVSFKIELINTSDSMDKIIIEDGRAALLFTYQD